MTITDYTRDRAISTARVLRERLLRESVLTVVAALGASLAVGGGIIAATGVNPLEALRVALDGALGSRLAIGETLVFATPRLLVALGAAVAIRSGVFNIGVEGQLQMGAVAAALVGVLMGPFFPPAHLTLALLAAGVAGGIWAGIAGLLKVLRGADEIIVTLMMSFIAIFFVQYLVQGPFQAKQSSFAYSEPIHTSAQLPKLLPNTSLHFGFVVGLICVAAVAFLIYRTTLGAQFRAVGFNLRAARVAGLPVNRLIMMSMFFSGFIAGLAGAGEILGVQFRLIQGFSPGFGFEGLAIAFLGSLEPVPILFIAIFFGGLQNGVLHLQQSLGVSASVAFIMEGIPILFLAAARGLSLVRGSRRTGGLARV